MMLEDVLPSRAVEVVGFPEDWMREMLETERLGLIDLCLRDDLTCREMTFLALGVYLHI